MKGVFINGLQGIFNKLIIMLIFLIYPSLNFSQVYQIKNEEVTTRVILDKEYIVLSKFELSKIVFFNLVADVLYGILDPRIRYD